jgi:solute:Na+ symporter, SSS family
VSLDLSRIDVSLYSLFFISLFLITMYVARTKEVTVESYFFANRSIHWLVLGASFLISSIFSLFFLGLTTAGMNTGMVISCGIVSIIMVVILGWFIGPRYLNTKIHTIPEYFEKRYGRNCRVFVSALYVFFNISIRLTILLVAGSVIINNLTGADSFSLLFFFLIITGAYVLAGGLHAEMYAGVIQIIFVALSVFAFLGWANQREGLFGQLSNVLSFKISSVSTWTGLVIGLPVLFFWFWCADQFIIQKVMSARDVVNTRKAALFSGFLQIIPVLIFIIPGFILSIFFKENIPNGTLQATFSFGALPNNLQWGVIIAVAAIMMAAFASLLNTTSLLITFDFYRIYKSAATDRALVLVGRITTMALLLYAILLIPITQTMDFNICLKLFKSLAYFGALISAVFLISLLNKRIQSPGVMWTLYAGTAIILTRAIIDVFFTSIHFENITTEWFAQSSFLDFSVFIFVISIIFLFVFDKINNSHKSITSRDHRS